MGNNTADTIMAMSPDVFVTTLRKRGLLHERRGINVQEIVDAQRVHHKVKAAGCSGTLLKQDGDAEDAGQSAVQAPDSCVKEARHARESPDRSHVLNRNGDPGEDAGDSFVVKKHASGSHVFVSAKNPKGKCCNGLTDLGPWMEIKHPYTAAT
jgi:hypothetical protein